jgi:hypothetical protein
MVDRPIIFSAPMIRALLGGRKGMTRRLLKGSAALSVANAWGGKTMSLPENGDLLPYAAGDRLWVRESITQSGAFIAYSADGAISRPRQIWPHTWKQDPRSSIHMPRTASRLTLAVTHVKVERLTDITEEDALREGVTWDAEREWFHVPGVTHPDKEFPVLSRTTAREMFAALWDVIHGSGAWLASPWVVAISFSVAKRNIDAKEAA